MIILKILLWIILALLGIILLILILPASVSVSYIGGKVAYSVKFAFLPVFSSKGNGIVNKLLEWRNKKSAAKGDESEDDEPKEESSAENEPSLQEKSADTAAPKEETAKIPETAEERAEIAENNPEDETVEAEEIAETPEQPLKPEKPVKPSNSEREKKSKLEFFIDLWEAADRPVLKIFKGIKISQLYIDFFIANEDAYKCALNYGKISGTIYNLIAWLSVLFNVKLKTVDINPLFGQKKSQWDVSLKVSLCLITVVIAGIQFLIIYLFRVLIPSKRQLRKAR